MPAYQRTRLGLARSFQLPKPFRSLNLVDNLRIPLLYTVNARHGAHLSSAAIDERCRALLADVALADKALHLPRDLTQVEMRKLELARAVASAPRLLFADEAMAGLSPSEVEEILVVLFRLNEQGITIVLDRAHHARGHELFDPARRAGRRPEDRRRRAAGGDPQPRGREGVSWRVAFR